LEVGGLKTLMYKQESGTQDISRHHSRHGMIVPTLIHPVNNIRGWTLEHEPDAEAVTSD
jgi:hypothetical protein